MSSFRIVFLLQSLGLPSYGRCFGLARKRKVRFDGLSDAPNVVLWFELPEGVILGSVIE